VSSFAGTLLEIVIPMGAFVSTVAVAVADLVGSVADVAVMAMVPPTATVELFWNVAVAPLAV
jgi:hypothetical protein